MEDAKYLENKPIKSKGGWITFPFLLGSKFGVTIATGGWYSNLIVFLIREFHVKSVNAALISNVVTGLTACFSVVGALLADTLFGSYLVTVAFSLLSLLGTVMFTVMSTVAALKPQPCSNATSTDCPSPTTFQNAYLYATLAVAAIGNGGTFLLYGTIGADQLDKGKHQRMILNWIITVWYFGLVLSFTVLVYIEDNVSWTLGFGIGVAANVIAVALFLGGTPFYRRTMPQGSPITGIARVLVASFRKMKMALPLQEQNVDCYYYQNMDSKLQYGPPSNTLRFLNRAAMVEDEATEGEAKVAKGESWKLCSVEEVEDLKKLIKLFPIWSAGIFFSVPVSISQSLIVLQALVMNRQLGNHFKIPAGTFVIFNILATAIGFIGLEVIFYPMWKRIIGKALRSLSRLGIGHCLNVVSMVGFALIERKRLSLVQPDGHGTPMSALWLVFPQVMTGIGEAFQFPGEVALHYQEFPKSLKNTSASIVSLRIAIAFYISAALIGLLQHTTSWMPNDINHGRLDYVYWSIAAIAFVNSIYYVTYARFYKYNNLSFDDDAGDH